MNHLSIHLKNEDLKLINEVNNSVKKLNLLLTVVLHNLLEK